jgi:hypothetical protein
MAPVGFAYPDPVAVCVDVVAVPDPEMVCYRVHLDLASTSATHQAEQVAPLLQLDAAPVDVGQGDVPWTVLADPRAMARFEGEAMDWTLHEVAADHARLRSTAGGGPCVELVRLRTSTRNAPLACRRA